MPRRGYVSVTMKRETWEKLQRLKHYIGAATYDELIDKIYSILVNAGLVELSKKLESLANRVNEISREVERVYELEKIIDTLLSEVESVKTQVSRFTVKLEVLEKRSREAKG